MELFLIGAGGHARELHSYIQDLQHTGWNGKLRGCLDDQLSPGLHGRLEVLGSLESLRTPPGAASFYHTADGSNPVRRKLVERLTELYGDADPPLDAGASSAGWSSAKISRSGRVLASRPESL